MRRFRAILARESTETDETVMIRVFPAGCFQWEIGPWPITLHHDDGALNGTVLGQADSIERLGDLIIGRGYLDDEGDGAAADLRRDVIRQVGLGLINAVSVEPAGLDVTEACTETDADGFCTAFRLTFDRYVIGAASVVTIPAIQGTLIELDPAEPAMPAMTAAPLPVPSIPDTIPAGWLDEPSDLPPIDAAGSRIPRVTDDGRVFGYLCSWQDCHISFAAYCQPPWHSASRYAYAHHCGPFQTDDGPVQLSPLAVTGGHYPTAGDAGHDWRGAQAHYDDPTACVAYVRFGENEHGVWYSGTLRQGVTAEQLALLTRHQLSGDWRRPDTSGGMELVGACSVNTPGFVRSVALVASGSGGEQEIVAAVIGQGPRQAAAHACSCGTTASAAPDDRLAALERTVAVLTETLGPQVRDTLRARLAAV